MSTRDDVRAVSASCLCRRCIWECLRGPFCGGHYHQPPEQRGLEDVLGHVLGSSDRCLHTGFRSPILAVTHVYITDIYCFQYELFKKCQETSCVCTLLTGTSTVCAAKSSTEGNLLPPLSCFLTVICHRWLGSFFLYRQHLVNTQD